MNENKYCIIEKSLLARIIGTLKLIDVRGYDSMDALVGCVTVLSNLHDAENLGFTKVSPEMDQPQATQMTIVVPKPAPRAEPETENSEEEG